MPCIYHVRRCFVDVLFSVLMVNSCKGYSRSFSFVLLVCVVSAASLQITVDHGRKQQENQKFSVGVCASHRLNRGLELNVCGVQCIELFQSFTSSTTAQKQTFSSTVFWQKTLLLYEILVIESYHIVFI